MFLMLIREMAFVFHKSKQAQTKVTLKKFSKTKNTYEISICSNEWFHSSSIKQKSCIVNDNGHESVNL